MNFPFLPSRGPIFVETSLSGPSGQADPRLILDTGATTSLIRTAILIAVGYDPNLSASRATVTMGNGVEQIPKVTLNRLSALGQHRLAFTVLAHTMPSSATSDGLLGLDFLRGTALTLDFLQGLIVLA